MTSDSICDSALEDVIKLTQQDIFQNQNYAQFMSIVSSNPNLIEDKVLPEELSLQSRSVLERLIQPGQNINSVFKIEIAKKLRSIIIADDVGLSARIQALRLCNLGLLASQDFLVGLNPRKYPLKDMNLQDIFKMCQNNLSLEEENKKTHKQNLHGLLNFCQSVMVNFSSVSPQSFSDDQEFVNWLQVELAGRRTVGDTIDGSASTVLDSGGVQIKHSMSQAQLQSNKQYNDQEVMIDGLRHQVQTEESVNKRRDSPQVRLIVDANGEVTKYKRKKRRRFTRSSSNSESAKNRFLQDHFELLPPQERLDIQAQIYSYGNLVNENSTIYSNKQLQISLKKFKKSLSPTERSTLGLWDSNRAKLLRRMVYQGFPFKASKSSVVKDSLLKHQTELYNLKKKAEMFVHDKHTMPGSNNDYQDPKIPKQFNTISHSDAAFSNTLQEGESVTKLRPIRSSVQGQDSFNKQRKFRRADKKALRLLQQAPNEHYPLHIVEKNYKQKQRSRQHAYQQLPPTHHSVRQSSKKLNSRKRKRSKSRSNAQESLEREAPQGILQSIPQSYIPPADKRTSSQLTNEASHDGNDKDTYKWLNNKEADDEVEIGAININEVPQSNPILKWNTRVGSRVLSHHSEAMTPRAANITKNEYQEQMRQSQQVWPEHKKKSYAFVSLEAVANSQAKTTYADNRFAQREESHKNRHSEVDSNLSTSYKTLIEDLIDKSEKRIEQKLVERIFGLSQSSEKNVTELYENMKKKIDDNGRKSKDNVKKIELDMKKLQMDYQDQYEQLSEQIEQFKQQIELQNLQIEQIAVPIQQSSDQIQLSKEKIRETSQTVETQNKTIVQLKSQIDEQNTQIERQNSQIQKQNTQIERQNTQIDRQNTLIDEQNSQFELQNSQIEQQNTQIEQKSTKSEQFGTQIQLLKEQMNSLKDQNADQSRQLAQCLKQIDEMKEGSGAAEDKLISQLNQEIEAKINTVMTLIQSQSALKTLDNTISEKINDEVTFENLKRENENQSPIQEMDQSLEQQEMIDMEKTAILVNKEDQASGRDSVEDQEKKEEDEKGSNGPDQAYGIQEMVQNETQKLQSLLDTQFSERFQLQDSTLKDLRQELIGGQETQRLKQKEYFDALKQQAQQMEEMIKLRLSEQDKMQRAAVKDQENKLLSTFQKKFNEHVKESDKIRIRGYREISTYTKSFFQEWLDENAIGSFNQIVNKKSSLHNDWVNVMNICSHMKFYSVSTVNKMTLFVKDKWIHSSVKHPDPDLNVPVPAQTRAIDKFIQFQHVSPYLLQLLDNLSSIANRVQANIDSQRSEIENKKNNESKVVSTQPYLTPILLQEIQTFVKTCSILEIFSYNHLNQLLIHKIQGADLLMSNLLKIIKSLKSLQDETVKAEKQVIVAVFKCLAVFLRQEIVIVNFLNHNNLYLLKIMQIMMEYCQSEQVSKYGIAVIRQICCKNDACYDAINKQLNIKHIQMFLLTKLLLMYDDSEIQEMSLVCVMQLQSRGQALVTCKFSLEKIYELMNPRVAKSIQERIEKLEQLYEVAQDVNKIHLSSSLATKLLNIYQFFSDDARIPTYLKLLNNSTEAGSKAGSHSQPAFLTDYLKYVRAIHLKYHESKQQNEQVVNQSSQEFVVKSGGNIQSSPEKSSTPQAQKGRVNTAFDTNILYSSDDYSEELKDLESSQGSVDSGYIQAQNATNQNEQQEFEKEFKEVIENYKTKKKQKDQETRRIQAGKAIKKGLKRMFKVDDVKKEEEQADAKKEFLKIYEVAKSEEMSNVD